MRSRSPASWLPVLAILAGIAQAAPAATVTETVTQIETYTLLIETILIQPTTVTIVEGCASSASSPGDGPSIQPPPIASTSRSPVTSARPSSGAVSSFAPRSSVATPTKSAVSTTAGGSSAHESSFTQAGSTSGISTSHASSSAAATVSSHSSSAPSASSSAPPACSTGVLQSRADEYRLNITLPGLPFDIPQSYAGYVPVNQTAGNTTRELYFWYTPVDASAGSDDDVIIWFNGGPGCSSMEGLFQENGPFQLPYYPEGGSVKPQINPWSNHKAAHAIWVDSPGDTGFSQAGLHVQGLTGVAEDIAGFLINFFERFPDLRGKKLWLQGESYAGAMIPYMAHRIYSDDSLFCKGINLKGVQINDPSWANDIYMQQLGIYPFAVQNKDLLGFNDSQIAQFQASAAPYGLDTYYSEHVVYPPKGPLPYPTNWTGPDTYDIYGEISNAWNGAHCSSVYDISTECPYTVDPLGYPQAAWYPSLDNFLNNQTGFLSAINVKPGVTFLECRDDVYDDLDLPPPNESVMPGVIARSEHVVIGGGDHDILLLTKGSELVIQNMTWNGEQGFQQGVKTDLVTSQGVRGHYITERSLSLVEFYYAGHMIPQDDGEAAYKATKYLIGTLDSLN